MAIQKYYSTTKTSANTFITNMESNDYSKMLDFVAKDMDNVTGNSVYGQLVTRTDKFTVYMNIFMQGLLCHESDSRINIVNKNILDSETLSEMIVDLRMAIYFDLCKVKREKWLSMIGDVTYADAYNADTDVFTGMIGSHTHGLCKDRFWAMLRASSGDIEKRKVFLSKSNGSVSTCYDKIR
jgi:dsDNA-binding SOS-regulon protein